MEYPTGTVEHADAAMQVQWPAAPSEDAGPAAWRRYGHPLIEMGLPGLRHV